jgi:phosphoribosyl-dephospho-CoA transferase
MYRRHELIWLSAHGWQRLLAEASEQQRQSLETWRKTGWPAVVRRADEGMCSEQLCIGLPFPPDPLNGSKLRIALRVNRGDVVHSEPPPDISSIMAAAPPAWRAPLQALQRDAQDLDLRIYGSLAWQSLTGQSYLHDASDIDVLLALNTRDQLQPALNLLHRHSQDLPLDGELVLPSGAAVAWKEWRNAQAGAAGTRLMVKELARVRLADANALLDENFGASCTR